MRICRDSNDIMLARCGVAHFGTTHAKCYIKFSPKSWITHLHSINVAISDISVNWFNEDMPRFQCHNARPMWNCPLREHSCQRFHIFQPEIMNHTFVQDKCDNFSNIGVNWFNEDMPRYQWLHARPMWSCPLREHSCQRFHIFQPKITNHTFVQDKCVIFKYKR